MADLAVRDSSEAGGSAGRGAATDSVDAGAGDAARDGAHADADAGRTADRAAEAVDSSAGERASNHERASNGDRASADAAHDACADGVRSRRAAAGADPPSACGDTAVARASAETAVAVRRAARCAATRAAGRAAGTEAGTSRPNCAGRRATDSVAVAAVNAAASCTAAQRHAVTGEESADGGESDDTAGDHAAGQRGG